MRIILTIFRKELKSYFISPIAYIFMITFLVFMSWYFFRGFFIVGEASMRSFFTFIPWIFLFFIPAISMRSWSDENKSGTLAFLLTFPVRDYEVVIGKYLASLVLMILTVLGTLPLVMVVNFFGDPDMGPIIGGYLGVILLGSAYLAIGFVMSLTTKNQIIAFIMSLLVCFFRV